MLLVDSHPIAAGPRAEEGSEDLFDFIPRESDAVMASLQSLAGPVDLMSMTLDHDHELALHATIEPDGDSPLWSCSDSTSSSDGDECKVYEGLVTPVSAGLTNDRFLFDASSSSATTSSSSASHPHASVTVAGLQAHAAAAAAGLVTPAKHFTFTFDGQHPFQVSPARPTAHSAKAQPAPHNPRVKQPKAFSPKGKRPGQSTQGPAVASKLASRLLPKVDKPSLGELNGKMPRPIVVNASPRRRRKTDKVTEEQIQAEEEARKIKSVQSARDCRKRKKEYIQGLQLAIAQYEKREAAAQQLIATLEKSIARLKTSA